MAAKAKSQAKRFKAVLEKGNRALGWTIARVPFDPAKEWKQMVRLRVRGEVWSQRRGAMRSGPRCFRMSAAGFICW